MALDLKVKSVYAPTVSMTSMEYQVQFTTDGTSHSVSNLKVEMYINHYIPEANFVAEVVVGGGNKVIGTEPGTCTLDSVTVEHRNSAGSPPKIFPTNEKVRTKLTLNFSGSSTISSSGHGWKDCHIRIRHSAYKYFQYQDTRISGETAQDIDASYSWETSTTYTNNTGFVLTDSAAVAYGTRPDFTTHKHVLVSASQFSWLQQANPTTSYESNAEMGVNCATGSVNKRSCGIWADPSLGATVDTILRAEAIFTHTGFGSIDTGTDTLDLTQLSATPDSTPTWNEMNPNFSTVLRSHPMSATYSSAWDNNCWMFQSTSLANYIKTFLNSYSAAAARMGLTYSVNDDSYHQEMRFASQAEATTTERPYIVVAYTEVVASSRRIVIC